MDLCVTFKRVLNLKGKEDVLKIRRYNKKDKKTMFYFYIVSIFSPNKRLSSFNDYRSRTND